MIGVIYVTCIWDLVPFNLAPYLKLGTNQGRALVSSIFPESISLATFPDSVSLDFLQNKFRASEPRLLAVSSIFCSFSGLVASFKLRYCCVYNVGSFFLLCAALFLFCNYWGALLGVGI